MEVRKSTHSIYRLQNHVVWGMQILPKYPESWDMRIYPKDITETADRGIGSRNRNDWLDHDHMHMIMVISPKYSISDAMGRMKSQSTSALRKKVHWLKKVYRKENLVWSPGFLSAVQGSLKKQ